MGIKEILLDGWNVGLFLLNLFWCYGKYMDNVNFLKFYFVYDFKV